MFSTTSWTPAFIAGCVAAVVISLGIAGLDAYTRVAFLDAVNDPRVMVTGRLPYVLPIVVQSFDERDGVMTIIAHSASIGQELVIRAYLSDSFRLERRDAIMEDGAVVGFKPVTDASLGELRFGVRGVASVWTDDSGKMVVEYILIGDPFPRP